MIIIFTPEEKTKKLPAYCVKYRFSDDDKVRIVHFGKKQRKQMFSWLSGNLNDFSIVEFQIICNYEN